MLTRATCFIALTAVQLSVLAVCVSARYTVAQTPTTSATAAAPKVSGPAFTVPELPLTVGICKVTLLAGKTQVTVPGVVQACTTGTGRLSCTAAIDAPPLAPGPYSVVTITQNHIDYPVHGVNIVLPASK